MKEIEKLINITDSSSSYRIINIGGRHLYIEGIKTIIEFNTNELQFNLKDKKLIIIGENIKTKYLDKTTCVLEGEIKSVEVK